MESEQDWETNHERHREETEKLLTSFVNVMIGDEKRGKKGVHTAAEHIEFFALEFLSAHEGGGLLDGLESFGSFVGDWFLRKCMWSNESSAKENIGSFRVFLEYLEISDEITAGRAADLRQLVDEGEELWCARALANDDPHLDWEEIHDEWGDWKDDFILQHARGGSTPPSAEDGGLTLILLFSARAAKFLGVTSSQSAKLRDWGEWASDEFHWSAWWRCEDAFAIEGSDNRALLLTNARTLYSFLVAVPPDGTEELVRMLHAKMMAAMSRQGITVPQSVDGSLLFLTGAARSLTGSMNEQLLATSDAMADEPTKAPENLERMLHRLVSLKLPEAFPDDAFAKMCAEDPLIVIDEGDQSSKVVPFPV